MATAAELQAKIDAIDTALDALAASPDALTSYKIGTRQFDKKTKAGSLLDMRRVYRDQLEALPSEEITIFDEPEL